MRIFLQPSSLRADLLLFLRVHVRYNFTNLKTYVRKYVSSISKTFEKYVNKNFVKIEKTNYEKMLKIVDYVKGYPYDFLPKITKISGARNDFGCAHKIAPLYQKFFFVLWTKTPHMSKF